ncbi:hypothetical protein C8Q76DRAFT_629879 [Earliella scabrosa]|nr:hypothetical protein C8Q76DRAFT_629879 [Earliella scabrosa]
MDIKTLRVWRAVCRQTYAESTGSLRRTIISIIQPFFPFPFTFLRHITSNRAMIGGVAAISFITRDPAISSKALQIYAGKLWYDSLVKTITSCSANKHRIARIRRSSAPEPFARERDIISTTSFHLHDGRAVIIYQAGAVSACSSISRLPLSALMTFFTEHTFACAYPSLTLSRRAILSNMRLGTACETDYLVMVALMQAGFEFAVNPCVWVEYRRPSGAPLVPDTYECLRHLYVCPQQGRFFGDPGSLVGYNNPLAITLPEVRSLQIPPFGPMAAWRLMTSYDCSNSCDVRDPILHEWVVSIPLIVLPNPFPLQGRNTTDDSNSQERRTTDEVLNPTMEGTRRTCRRSWSS